MRTCIVFAYLLLTTFRGYAQEQAVAPPAGDDVMPAGVELKKEICDVEVRIYRIEGKMSPDTNQTHIAFGDDMTFTVDGEPYMISSGEISPVNSPSSGKAVLWSSPQLRTIMGEKARIFVGDNAPVQYFEPVEGGKFVIHTDQQEKGISCEVVADKTDEGMIRLNVNLSISWIGARAPLEGVSLPVGKPNLVKVERQFEVAISNNAWCVLLLPVPPQDDQPKDVTLVVPIQASLPSMTQAGVQTSVGTEAPQECKVSARFYEVSDDGGTFKHWAVNYTENALSQDLLYAITKSSESEWEDFLEQTFGVLEMISAPRVALRFSEAPLPDFPGLDASKKVSGVAMVVDSAPVHVDQADFSKNAESGGAPVASEDSLGTVLDNDDAVLQQWVNQYKEMKAAIVLDASNVRIDYGSNETKMASIGVVMGVVSHWDAETSEAVLSAYFNHTYMKGAPKKWRGNPESLYINTPSVVRFACKPGESRAFLRRTPDSDKWLLVLITLEK